MQVGYTSYPDNVVRNFTAQAVRSGVDIFRIFDSLNYVDNLKFGMDAVAAAGGIVEGTICYSGARPKHAALSADGVAVMLASESMSWSMVCSANCIELPHQSGF